MVLGGWSTNIGNAFFQLGAAAILRRALPDAKVGLIADQLGYPMYWNPKGGNSPGAFDMVPLSNADAVVVLGPLFRRELRQIWGRAFEQLRRDSVPIVMLGVGAMTYDREDLSFYRRMLADYPPYVLASRDRETYEALGDLAQHAYDGIDLGFFVGEAYRPLGLRQGVKYLTLNFDKIPEPEILVARGKPELELRKDATGDSLAFAFDERSWCLRFHRRRKALARRSRYFMMLEGIVFRGSSVRQVDEYRIVRTDHRANPMIPRKVYRSPEVMVNDTPYPYLEVYASSTLTLSCRLHACVATLAYGNAALLVSDSPRLRMLERLGLEDITARPVTLNRDILAAERDRLVQFLVRTLQ